MDALTLFGLFAVSAMLVCYAFENRSHWFVLLFAGSCALGSAYGFLQELGHLVWSRQSGRLSHFDAGLWCEHRPPSIGQPGTRRPFPSDCAGQINC